ncbi:diaminopimelate decarboxylase [Marivibrio halodurans]|uniref:Diaminopimelate decarboxylase n=1 Tax=Marivibrio halodurans TaxID=2039722 RepID=A0A8J7S378_9PROT|nr:diaminopimelate decarboxylase [Marivibrio halodurans]
MNHFEYRNGVLHAEGVPLPRIAAEVGTPVYVYSTATLTRHYRVFADAFAATGLDATVCYAVKANSNQAVIATLAQLGAGADVVSEGELRRALAAGVPRGKIVFSGVGKSAAEMAFAIEAGIAQINVESVAELDQLSRVASGMGAEVPIALRVNPDVDAKTHAKISTGKKENKFGIDIDDAPAIFARARDLPGLAPISIAVHIGSQLTDLAPYRAAFGRVADLARALQADGFDIRHLDLGGGLGIPYDAEDPPPPDAYARMVAETVGDLGLPVMLEPGRMIVGNAGVLLARTLYIKQGREKRFAVLDAAMNDLIRPALYDGHHRIQRVREPEADAEPLAYDVVGPVCESGDTFATGRRIAPLAADDLVVFGSAGAYGAVMASTYNSRLLVPEVLVNGDRYAVVRGRQTYDEMIGQDRLADWLRADAPEPSVTDNQETPRRAAGADG